MINSEEYFQKIFIKLQLDKYQLENISQMRFFKKNIQEVTIIDKPLEFLLS